jgi:2-C-methyl-D-erythritol 4-phosphate cytidylyltransferase
MSVENKHSVVAIILAAGSSRRMGTEITKQKMEILGKSVLRRTLEAFESASEIDGIVVVAKEDEIGFVNDTANGINKLYKIVSGGKNRAESAKNGVACINRDVDAILIHDAARCLVTPDLIDSVAKAVHVHGAVTVASRVTDTLKKIDENGMITGTVRRDEMLAVQTPQAFSYDLYLRALKNAETLDETITDDNMLVERLGIPVYPLVSDAVNVKITTPADIDLAEFVLRKRQKI